MIKKITLLLLILTLTTGVAMAQDEQLKINIAIIKLTAMIEYNNQQILNLTRTATKFDDQLKILRAQSEALQKAEEKRKAQADKDKPKPDVKK